MGSKSKTCASLRWNKFLLEVGNLDCFTSRKWSVVLPETIDIDLSFL